MPTDRSFVVFPSNVDFVWTKASADEFVADAIRLLVASLPVVYVEYPDTVVFYLPCDSSSHPFGTPEMIVTRQSQLSLNST